MTRWLKTLTGIGLTFGVLGAQLVQAATPFTLQSATFADGTPMPRDAGGNLKANPNCKGTNVSPQLTWANPPAGTKSFAITMFDPQARGGEGFSHWVAYGINPEITSLKLGEASAVNPHIVGGKSGVGVMTYFGPCPPPGDSAHHYEIVIVATDLAPDALKAGLDRAQLAEALKGHRLGDAELVGLYGN